MAYKNFGMAGIGSVAGWSVQSAATTGSSANVTNTIHKQVTNGTSMIGVYSAVKLYFNFSTTTTDVNASNDLVLDKDTLIFLTVPLALGPGSIYFNHNSTSTTTGAVRIVEI